MLQKQNLKLQKSVGFEKDPAAVEPGAAANSDTKTTTTSASSSVPMFRIITGSYEHTLMCLSLALYPQGEVFTPIFYFTPHTQSIKCLAHSKRYLVSGGNDERIRIYDLQKRKELGTLLHHDGSINVLKFYDAKWLISGAVDGKICIWRTKDWDVLAEMKGHKAQINDISVHPSGRLALSVADDKTLRLWNLMTARKASIVGLPEKALKVSWTPEGLHYVIGYYRKLVIFHAETSKKVDEIELKSPLQHLEIIQANGKSYIVSSHNDGKLVFRNLDDLLQVVDDDDKTTIEEFELIAHAVRVKHFSSLHDKLSDTTYLTSVSSDGKIVTWNLTTREEVAVYSSSDRLNCCILVPDDVEQYDTVKRGPDEELSASDYSEVESDVETVSKQRKKKGKKNKKPKVSVELEK